MDLTLQFCPSPDLIACYAQQDWDSTLVVITDVFRASATILSALYHGAIEVRPVATIEESLQYQNDPDYLVAAERNARRVEGATLGNDPEEYTRDRVEGKRVVLTTTNGTRALHLAQEAGAKHIAVGTFGNISCLSEYILREKFKSVLVVAAGWKGQLAGEDCLFAGALLHHIGERNVDAKGINDALLMAEISFQKYKDDLLSFINRVEHYARLEQLGYLPTIAVCLEQDRYPILPLFDLERQTLLPLQ